MPLPFDWMCWTLGGLAAATGLAAVYWALLHDRSRGRRRCPKCWYDMAGSPTLTCPECGREASSPRRLLRTRRRWGWGAVAVVVVAAGLAGAAWPRASVRGWLSFVPAPVLFVLATADWMPTEAPTNHLLYRSAAGGEITRLGRAVLVSQCIRTLRVGSDVKDRDTAGIVLGWIGARDARVTAALLDALDDRSPVIRVRAIRSMGICHADSDRAVPALMRVLERGTSERPEVRTEALGVLSNYRARAAGAASLFVEAMNDPDPAIATRAVAAMHRVGVEPADHLPQLLAMLENLPAGADRGNVVIALRYSGPAGAAAVPALIQLLASSSDPWVEPEVVAALGHIGPAAAAALPAILAWQQANPSWQVQTDAAAAVIRGEYPSYISAVGAALRDVDPAERERAASELRRLAVFSRDRSDVLVLLRQALDDPDPGVVLSACGGLAMVGRDAEPCLPRLYELRRAGHSLADFAIQGIERAETPPLPR